MFKFLKQLLCRHEKTVWDHTDLLLQQGNRYKSQHFWKCVRCGKVFPSKRK